MENKSYKFQTGVLVSVQENTISAKDNGGVDKMDSNNFDSFGYEHFVQPKISPAGLATIPFAIGCLIFFFTKEENGPLFYFGLILLLLALIGFIFIVFDGLLQLNLARNLIAKIWSIKGYAITIGSKSGNNLQFFALSTELNQIKALETRLDELKAFLNSINDTTSSTHVNIQSNYIDELEKLAKLKDSSVITEDEFNQKKKELLGL